MAKMYTYKDFATGDIKKTQGRFAVGLTFSIMVLTCVSKKSFKKNIAYNPLVYYNELGSK